MNTNPISTNIKIEPSPNVWSMGDAAGQWSNWHNGMAKKNQLCFTIDHCDAWDLRPVVENIQYEKYSYAKLRKLVDAGDFDTIANATKGIVKSNFVGPTKVYLGRFSINLEFSKNQQFNLDMQQALFTTYFYCLIN